MSAMKSIEKLRSLAGANIIESMSRPTAGPGVPTFSGAPADHDRRAGLNRVKGAFQIPTDRIVPDPDQPRKEFDEEALDRLAESLRERGQLQPIRVRWDAALDQWVIIAGERRWRAATRAGLATLAAVEATASQTADDILEDQLVENCLREDLKPIEQARAFQALMDRRGWPAVRLAQALRLNDATVTRALALLGLPDTVQDRVESGALAPSVAYEISKVEDAATQAELAARVVAEGLNRAETVAAVRRASGRTSGASRGQGRGGARGPARKITARVFRTTAGPRVTVEFKKGLEPRATAAALREVLDQVEAELNASCTVQDDRPPDAMARELTP